LGKGTSSIVTSLQSSIILESRRIIERGRGKKTPHRFAGRGNCKARRWVPRGSVKREADIPRALLNLWRKKGFIRKSFVAAISLRVFGRGRKGPRGRGERGGAGGGAFNEKKKRNAGLKGKRRRR